MSHQLSRLQDFRRDVWGNKSIFRKRSIHDSHTIDYLDFAEHLPAVQSFCHAVSNKLVVFKEYGIAMDRFKKEDMAYKRGACIIGQPGIGKTSFIAYAVIERLREKHPVAVQVAWSHHPQYILFTESTVSLHDEGETDPLEAHPQIWVFSNSNTHVLQPLLAFTNSFDVRLFQTTSFAEEHWRDWTKQSKVHQYTMDLPSTEEIEDVVFLLEKDMLGKNSPHSLYFTADAHPWRQEGLQKDSY